jgi:hypothetical protein
MSDPVVSRNLVVQCWGTPQVTVGSVNEPREMEENGHRFNEKWVYRLVPTSPDGPSERVIYWHRYDFVGSCLVSKNGVVMPDDLARTLGGRRDRRYHPPAQ